MEPKKQKHQKNHVVIVTSDADDASVKQFRISQWAMWLFIIICCVMIGAGLGYIMYADQIWSEANRQVDEYEEWMEEYQADTLARMEDAAKENKEAQTKVEELEKQCSILSDTVNIKDAELLQMTELLEKLYNPTLLPLTGRVTIEEQTDSEPACLFHATEGALVIAAAGGKVTELIEEPEMGYRVTVDHGNGYMTIYCNKEIPKVKQGDNITQGATIYVIGEESPELVYQVIKDGMYINPMDVIKIEG